MNPLVTDQIQAELEAAVVDFFAFLPDLVVAIVILLIAKYVSTAVEPVAMRLGRRAQLGKRLSQTPLGVLVPEREGAVDDALGTVARYYVLLIGFFVAVQHLGFVAVSGLLQRAVLYVPSLVAGIAILGIGLFVADRASAAVRDSQTAAETGYAAPLAAGTKVLLYFAVIVIGLDTMGIDVGILYVFGETFALAVGVAFALAVGIAVGWGGKDYVAENLDEWADSSGGAPSETSFESTTDDD